MKKNAKIKPMGDFTQYSGATECLTIEALDMLDETDERKAYLEAEKILCGYLRAIGHDNVGKALKRASRRTGFWYG